jgi:thiol-disulfide isomerase/thioredoxin
MGLKMPFLRPRLFAALALLVAGGAASVLYVIHASAVHAGNKPPPDLARLILQQNPMSAPAVGFTGPDGNRVTLASFRGQTVILNLWATWCAPCVRELPQLAQVQSALPGVAVVAVNVGRDKTAETAAFLKSHGAGGLAAYVDTDAALIRAFNTEGLPFSVIVDPKGHAIARAVGPCEWGTPSAIAYLRILAAPAVHASS